MDIDSSLADVRRKIDAIDETIQDLLVERTELVETVRDLKRDLRIKIRPAREAEIIYRLVARQTGPFPKQSLAAIWRQIITATLSFEGPFSVAVLTPDDVRGYWDLARDHFGGIVPMTRHTSVRLVIEAVRSQDATVGVLPVVRTDDDDPWWRHIVNTQPDVPRIIARLPFAGRGNALDGDLEALVVCPVENAPSGRDRTVFALDLEPGIGLGQVKSILDECALPALLAAQWAEGEGHVAHLYLFEVDGFVVADDPRFAEIEERFGSLLKRRVMLGSYAQPLTAEELAPVRRGKKPGRARQTPNAGAAAG